MWTPYTVQPTNILQVTLSVPVTYTTYLPTYLPTYLFTYLPTGHEGRQEGHQGLRGLPGLVSRDDGKTNNSLFSVLDISKRTDLAAAYVSFRHKWQPLLEFLQEALFPDIFLYVLHCKKIGCNPYLFIITLRGTVWGCQWTCGSAEGTLHIVKTYHILMLPLHTVNLLPPK